MWRDLWKRITNERGQLTLPMTTTTAPTSPLSGIDIGAILRSLGGLVNPTVGNALGTIGTAAQPFLGAGLIGAGLAQKEEPGYATEAIQYLRNRLAPTGIADQFSSQIGALNEEYRPYLEQQRNQLLDQTQQRFIAGQPSSFSTAMSGPEIAAIRNAITNQILPGERAHIADVGRYLLTTGGTAAGTLLDYAKPDPLGEYLATLGINLLGNRGGQAVQGGQPRTALNALGQTGSAIFDQFSNQGPTLLQALGLSPGGPPLMPEHGAAFTNQISQLLGGAQIGAFEDIGNGAVGVLDQSGKVIASIAPNGTVINQVTGEVVAGSVGPGNALAGFLGSPLAATLGLAGAGVGGYFLGNKLGAEIGSNQFQASGTGALSGAATGALIGSVVPGIGTAIGAIVGGLSGLFGGLFGERSQQRAEKAYNLSQDLDSQKDQVLEIGNIGVQFGQQLGIPSSAIQSFMAQAQSLAQTSESPADEQMMIAQALGTMLRQYVPSDLWVTLAPQLRSQYIDYMTRSTFTAPNSSYSGGAPQDLINKWGGFIGLAKGGYITRPTNAIVGERGVELAHLETGSYVIPFQHSRN